MVANMSLLNVVRVIITVILFSFVINNVNAETFLSKKDVDWLEKKQEIKNIGCSSYSTSFIKEGDFFSKKTGVDIYEEQFKNKLIFDDGELNCYFDAGRLEKDNAKLSVAEKVIIDGVKVSIYHGSGSGSIGENYTDKSAWSLDCKVDSMSDDLTCYIFKDSFYLLKDKNGYMVFVGTEHFPNTHAYIRHGKSKPFESDANGIFSLADSKAIIDSLYIGDKAITRYTKWPHKEPIDNELDIRYFKLSMKILDIAYESHK